MVVDVDPAWINKAPDPATDPAYAAAELRRNESVLMHPGHIDRLGAREGVRPGTLPVSLSGTTWTVHNVPVVIYPALSNTAGPYRVALLETSGEIDAADGTDPRKDILIAEIKDHDQDSSGLRLARPRYIAGAPAPTPSEPSVPAGAFRMATIDVPAGGTPAPSITYNAPLTVAAGGVLPVRDSSELPTSGLYAGMAAYRQDIDKLVVYDGAAWQEFPRVTESHARYIAVNPESIPNAGWTPFRTGTTVDECAHVTNVDNYVFTLNTSGVYLIEGGARFDSSSSGSRHHVISDELGDSARFTGQSMNGAAAGTHSVSSSFVRHFTAGQQIQQYLWQNSGGALSTNPTGEIVHLSFTLLAES